MPEGVKQVFGRGDEDFERFFVRWLKTTTGFYVRMKDESSR